MEGGGEAGAAECRQQLRNYRYRLLPSKAQHRRLEAILESERQLYNAALQERIDGYRKTGRSLHYSDQSRSLTLVRREDREGFGGVPVTLSRHTLQRLERAFGGFFGRLKQGTPPGFPRFKGRGHWDSFGFAEWEGIRLIDGKLRIKGLVGGLAVHWHRPLPASHRLLAAVLRRDAKGWCVCFMLEMPQAVSSHPGPAVGLDIGVHHFAVLSDGQVIPNPRAAQRAQRRLRRAQRALSRCQRHSQRRRKRRRQLTRLHQRLANSRDTFLHQQSARLARSYSLVAVEKLRLLSLTASARGTPDRSGQHVKQKAGLNRALLDVSAAKFFLYLGYKAASAGGRVVSVDPNGTSQQCAQCAIRVPKALSQRMHVCPHCGEVADRDLNAARNILHRAVVGPGQPNVAHQSERAAGNLMSSHPVREGSK